MPLTNSLGSYFPLGISKPTDLTPQQGDLLQTSGSGTTQGAMVIIGSAASADEFGLLFLNVWLTAQTGTAVQAVVYVATTAIAQLGPYTTTGITPLTAFMNFGPYGLIAGTTTTATVYAITSGGTATVNWILQGFRKV
jgi:hypothetical protein